MYVYVVLLFFLKKILLNGIFFLVDGAEDTKDVYIVLAPEYPALLRLIIITLLFKVAEHDYNHLKCYHITKWMP